VDKIDEVINRQINKSYQTSVVHTKPNWCSTYFYCATLCVTWYLLWPGVRLSVCMSAHLSVTFVHSIQMAEDIVRLCRSGSPIILVFLTQAPISNSREPLQWGHKIQGGVEIFVIFDW